MIAIKPISADHSVDPTPIKTVSQTYKKIAVVALGILLGTAVGLISALFIPNLYLVSGLAVTGACIGAAITMLITSCLQKVKNESDDDNEYHASVKRARDAEAATPTYIAYPGSDDAEDSTPTHIAYPSSVDESTAGRKLKKRLQFTLPRTQKLPKEQLAAAAQQETSHVAVHPVPHSQNDRKTLVLTTNEII